MRISHCCMGFLAEWEGFSNSLPRQTKCGLAHLSGQYCEHSGIQVSLRCFTSQLSKWYLVSTTDILLRKVTGFSEIRTSDHFYLLFIVKAVALPVRHIAVTTLFASLPISSTSQNRKKKIFNSNLALRFVLKSCDVKEHVAIGITTAIVFVSHCL